MRPPRLSSNIIFIFNHTCYPCSLPTITYATLAHYPRYWNFTCSFFTGGIVCSLLALLITHAIETSCSFFTGGIVRCLLALLIIHAIEISPALLSQVASYAASSPCSLPTLLKFHLLFFHRWHRLLPPRLAHYPRYWNFTCSFFTGGIIRCLLALLITHAIEISPAFYFAGGIVRCLLAPLMAGSAMCFAPAFDSSLFWALLAKYPWINWWAACLLWHDNDHFAVTWLWSFCCDMTVIILLWHDNDHFAVTWLSSFCCDMTVIILRVARTVYLHRIWPYVWWFPCQKCRIYTICTYKCVLWHGNDQFVWEGPW